MTNQVASLPKDRTGQVWESNGYVTHLIVGPPTWSSSAWSHPSIVLWAHDALAHAYAIGSAAHVWEDPRRSLEREASLRCFYSPAPDPGTSTGT